MTHPTLRSGRTRLPDGASSLLRRAGLLFGVTLSVVLLFWTAVAGLVGTNLVMLAPIVVVMETALPFAIGAGLYAVFATVVERSFRTQITPVRVSLAIFSCLGIGSWAAHFAFPGYHLQLSVFPGAVTGAIAAIAVGVLASRGHIHHDSE